jgi:hypothetical protein
MEQRTLKITKTKNNDGLPRYSLSERADDKTKRVCWIEGVGDDEEGILIGEWIYIRFHERLRTITTAHTGLSFHDPDYYNPRRVYVRDASASPIPQDRCTKPMINGAFGFESMRLIAHAIGIEIVRGKKKQEYLVTILDEEERSNA